MRNALARELLTARLEKKVCISQVAQCYHFEFVVEGVESFPFASGQFISAVAEDPNGKQQTRAYSIASAARESRFDLCVNRVEGGFFSNHLADLTDLEPGATIQIHGPPRRRGTRHETDVYYQDEFEALARRKPNFHYLPTLSRALPDWTGLRGYVQDHASKIVEERAARLGIPLPQPPVDPATPKADLNFDIYCYICGLNFMVSAARERLAGYGWHRKQIVFERYD